jgi:hypothetical protein
LSGYTHIFLEKSSMKVKKYLAPPKDMFFMGPHISECTISNTLVARVAPSLAYVASQKCSPHIQWVGNHINDPIVDLYKAHSPPLVQHPHHTPHC